jgi:peptidyl-tRNA hydrolase, PTH1 family
MSRIMLINSLFSFFKNILSPKDTPKTEPDTMKYLIAGLGNIGNDYESTRHNVGFDVVDLLAKELGGTFKHDSQAFVAEVKHKGRTFVLIKPTTYMNLSGKAVRYWLTKHNIPKENLLVVLDDLALPFGKQRLRPSGSDGGHNGLKSIDQLCGGSEFGKGQQADYVLGKWSNEEAKQLPDIVKYAADTVKAFGTIGIAFTMNQFNKK